MKKLMILLVVQSLLITGCSVSEDLNETNEVNDVIPVNVDELVDTVSELDRSEKIVLINKWHNDLYDAKNLKLFPILLTANLEDPVLNSIIKEENFGDNFNADTIKAIGAWSENEIAHTQLLEVFKNEPGKDPWGVYKGIPTYKKLLPSEMLAMSKFSSKYSGKCGSITNLIYSLMRKTGMESEQGVVVRLGTHTMGLVKVSGKVYGIDNNYIIELSEKLMSKVARNRYYGFYNDNVSYKGSFTITEEMLKSDNSLIEEIVQGNEITEGDLNYLSTNENEINYALQSMNVKDTSIYLDASQLGPLVTELSTELNDIELILSWVEENIQSEHIFKISDTVQTADQTIVFEVGNEIDKGLLIMSLMKNNDIDGELYITTEDVYIVTSDWNYSVIEQSFVVEVEGIVNEILK